MNERPHASNLDTCFPRFGPYWIAETPSEDLFPHYDVPKLEFCVELCMAVPGEGSSVEGHLSSGPPYFCLTSKPVMRVMGHGSCKRLAETPGARSPTSRFHWKRNIMDVYSIFMAIHVQNKMQKEPGSKIYLPLGSVFSRLALGTS